MKGQSHDEVKFGQKLLVYKCSFRANVYRVDGSQWTPAGNRGHFPLWKYCKVFLCISSYSKTLSRRIIYAVFSQLVGFWGASTLQTSPGLNPWTPLGDFRLQTPSYSVTSALHDERRTTDEDGDASNG